MPRPSASAPASAPADHFSPERSRLRELSAALTSLRKASPLLHRLAGGAHHGAISACAALAAYLPTQALGLKEGFWSAITAISVVQTEFQATETTARDQFIGAAIGGVIGVCASLALGQSLPVYAAAVVVSMLACWALNVASSSRLAAVTATIILLVPHTGSPERMFGSRLIEVGWGVCVAVVAVWVAARLPARHLGHPGSDAGSKR
ncbi:MAG TPA: FUSC family protein [Steroidobacteraceae bacterium]|jgi:uncharacterized membrane protein YccC|nr:FUSC family protein [Steroidobacteraceae bacterium]